jgi:hypothetical protein
MRYPIQSIVDRIDRNYSKVKFYAQRTPSSRFERLTINYIGNSIEEIQNKKSFLNACEASIYKRPFWIVAVA